jgi:hypothetical protein
MSATMGDRPLCPASHTNMADDDLRALLSELDPVLRDHLRKVLIRDQADRDAIASKLLRYRDQNGRTGPTSSTC